MNFIEFNNEGISDLAVQFHNELNPNLWENNRLKRTIRLALLKIAKDFKDYIGLENIKIKDITISGSNAAYTYTKSSDLDLHLVVDIPVKEKDTLSQLFDAKKNQYNYQYDITVKGIDVELYVQDSEQPHYSAGIYSVLKDEWVSEPKQEAATIDDDDVREKVKNYLAKIKMAMQSKDMDQIDSVMDNIKKLRQNGLEREGELSTENIAFKVLRAKGWIDALRKHKYKIHAAELSVETMK